MEVTKRSGGGGRGLRLHFPLTATDVAKKCNPSMTFLRLRECKLMLRIQHLGFRQVVQVLFFL